VYCSWGGIIVVAAVLALVFMLRRSCLGKKKFAIAQACSLG
jgi:hypothetical protein